MCDLIAKIFPWGVEHIGSMPLAGQIALAFAVLAAVVLGHYGIHAAASVLVAFLRPYILPLIATRENLEKAAPSYANFGKSFFAYAAILVVIHHFVLFMLEAFAFAHIGIVLLRTLCSALATMALIFCLQILTPKRR